MHEYLTRPRRSWLFTPATRPDRFDKAIAAGADVLIIDLEDAVAPADKDRARQAALDYLVSGAPRRAATALRINGLDTRAGLADLGALLAAKAEPDFLVLPKTEAGAHLAILDGLLGNARMQVRLVALVESTPALARLDEIASQSGRLAAVMFGAADMAADLGAETAWEPLLHARSAIVATCARHALPALDAPFFDIRDADGLANEVLRARGLGFAGKAAIHPSQIATIHAALTPDAEEVAKARAILTENQKGVGVVDGRMVDEAIARKARRTLAAAGIPA